MSISSTSPSSGLIIPTPTAPAAPPSGFQQRSSGLLLPTLTVPTTGSLVMPQAGDLDRIPELARQQHDRLAEQFGAPAADALVGAQLHTVESAAAQIRHDRIIAAFMSGDFAGALAAAGQH